MDRILTYLLLLPTVEIQTYLTVPWSLTVYTTKQSWNEGYELCRNNNQTLLSIRNEKKYEALGVILPIWRANAYLNDDYWIGLFDKDPPEGNYTWTDCTSKSDFELWDTGEPDERATSLCVRVYQYSGKWRTFFCDDYYQIICEQILDSCWFEEFQGYILQGTLKSYVEPGIAECEERCSNFVDAERECVGFSFGFGLCRMLLEEFVYVGSDPAVTANTNYDTYVKRCYEYHTETYIGNLTVNKERIPEHTCDPPSLSSSSSLATDLGTSSEIAMSSTTDQVTSSEYIIASSTDLETTLSEIAMSSTTDQVTLSESSISSTTDQLTSTDLVTSSELATISSVDLVMSTESPTPLTDLGMSSEETTSSEFTVLSPSTDVLTTSGQPLSSTDSVIPLRSSVMEDASSEFLESSFTSTFDLTDSTSVGNVPAMGMFQWSSYSSDSRSTSVVDISEKIESSFSQPVTDVNYSTVVFTPLYPSTSFSFSFSSSSPSPDPIITVNYEETSVYSARVFCPCKCFTEVEVATVEAEIIEEIKKELVINTTSLSSFKRKFSSAEDNRSSAVLVGSIGIGFLVAIVLFFAILDLNHMIRGLKNILEHYRANRINILYGSK